MKKSIAIIGVKGFPAFGGSARANECITELLKGKYRFTFYVLNSHHDKDHSIGDAKFIIMKSFRNKQLSVLAYYWKAMVHALFLGKYDLIQMNHYSSGLTIPFLRIKYTVVSTLRGILGRYDVKFGLIANLYFKIAEICFFKFSNQIVSVSSSQITYARRFTRKEIIHIPNGIDTRQMDSLPEIDEKNYLLFAAARIFDIKGCHTFMEALHRLNCSDRILIIGDPGQVPSYKLKITGLAAGLNIRFIPIIKDKKLLFSYLTNARLFVFPSIIEGMSNMLLEVASCKTPVVASDIPANTSIFSSDEMLFFKTGDPDDLSGKIRWALDNMEEMARKAQKAFCKLVENYTWETIARKYDALFEKILCGKRPGTN